MNPQRIQRKRTRGWRMPPNTVYVGRPTQFGNPYRVGDNDPMLVGAKLTPESAVRMFRWYLQSRPELKAKVVAQLRGKNLACWCKPGAPCHADVLLEIANTRLPII